jgi:D-sedoheptulose 7-phosphate isomerase
MTMVSTESLSDKALGRAGDVLISISASGSSPTVIRAVEAARKRNIRTISLTRDGGRLTAMADIAIAVPSVDIQYSGSASGG